MLRIATLANIAIVLASILLANQAFAQGAPASPNLFWATPISGSGYLALRTIDASDLAGASSNIGANTLIGNPTGAGAPAQPITLVSPFAFSGTTFSPGGVTCSGAPTGSFASTNGIVTHC